MENADTDAVRKILGVDPRLDRLELASRAIGLRGNELIHAGPPIADPAEICRPILHSAITAARFEGWAQSIEEAEGLLRSGEIRLRAAQDLNCVVPLADVASPSMWLQGVRHGRSACWSPINGGMTNVLRVGVLGEDVLAHLRWLNGRFAEAFAQALTTPVRVLDLADRGLAGGDDCHGRTAVATAALLETIDDRVTGDRGQALREFLQRSPSFFLNIWMAASKLMLDAARGSGASTVITAAGGNGSAFGIQIASRPGEWFAVPAMPPAVAPGSLGSAQALGAIGDSAVVDMLGLGAMTNLERGLAPQLPAFIGQTDGLAALLYARHPAMARTHPLMVTSAQRAVESGRAPIMSLGVLDKEGRLGRLTGGYYRPPGAIFRRVLDAARA